MFHAHFDPFVKFCHIPPKMPVPAFCSVQLALRSSWLFRFTAVRPANLSPEADDLLRPATAALAAGLLASAVLDTSFGGLLDMVAVVEVPEDWLLLRGL